MQKKTLIWLKFYHISVITISRLLDKNRKGMLAPCGMRERRKSYVAELFPPPQDCFLLFISHLGLNNDLDRNAGLPNPLEEIEKRGRLEAMPQTTPQASGLSWKLNLLLQLLLRKFKIFNLTGIDRGIDMSKFPFEHIKSYYF